MSKVLPFFEVGTDPRDGTQFCLLSLSGARQLAEVLTEAVNIMTEGLAERPELDNDVCKIETNCGKVHVVFMTDNTLDKIMGVAKGLIGLPADFDPWIKKDGTKINTDIPDWLMNLGLAIDGDGLKSINPNPDALQSPNFPEDNNPED